MRQQKSFISIWFCLLWTILSFMIVYFFEVAISPRYELFYGDCTVFKTVALSWIDGNIPYKDIFDHKGPYQYLINVIGLLISGKWGLFLLSSINLSIVTIILWLTCNLRLKMYQSAICICIFLGCYICVNNGGNMTETWSLLFCVIPLYLFCYSALKGSVKWWHNIIYGFCFGIIAFIRINNGIIPASIILVLFIKAIREKQLKLAVNQIGFQLFGVLLAILPIIAYFSKNDALYDLFYANYIFNIEYMLKWANIAGDNHSDMINRIWINIQWLFPLVILFIWSLRDYILKLGSREISLMLVVASGVTILANYKGMNYLHYYITFLPLILIASAKVFTLIQKWKFKSILPQLMSVLFVLWFVIVLTPALFGWTLQLGKDVYKFGIIHSSDSNYEIDPIERMILRNIPTPMSDKIYNVGTYEGAAALLKMKSVPAGKYFFLQSKLSKVSALVENELNEYHHNARPDYILTNKENVNSGNESFVMMLEKYQLVDSTENSIYLLKIKDINHE